MQLVMLLMIVAATLQAGSPHDLPKEHEMQSFVDEVLAMTGLHNRVDVVIDPSAEGCAYAATIDFKQVIGVDPKCVGPLRDKAKSYNWRCVGILTHEVAHLLSGGTTDGKGSEPQKESEADEWSGWAMYRLGATLGQAQAFSASVDEQGGSTHPGRAVRLASVARGWKNAQGGKMPARPKSIPERWAEFMKEPLPWTRQ